MNNIIPIDQAQGAAAMRAKLAAGNAVNRNFSEGVRESFPVLSIKGKVFRHRLGGNETPFIDPQTRQPFAFIDVVLVNASRTLSKAYYIRGFSDGDMNPPDCWSLDAVKPDPSVANKVHPTCGDCPMNAFGSRVTEGGKMAKACQDARRIAVTLPGWLGQAGRDPMMLRIPQSSLKQLKAYAQLLEKHGFEPNGCVTRLSFDYQEAFPKLLFNFVAPLTDPEYAQVDALAQSQAVTGMLSAPDFENAPSHQPIHNPQIAPLVRQATPMLGLADEDEAPAAVQQAAVAATQAVREEAKLDGLIELPDGRLFNPLTKQYVEKPKPVVAEVPSHVIEMPDGQLYDTVAKKYVERPQPKVEMPELDPNITELPDGKFYNMVTKQYVESPNKHAKPALPEVKTTRTRAKPAPKKEAAPEPVAEVKAEAPVEQAQPANGKAHDTAVSAAPDDMEDVLEQLLPPIKK